jgi:hypothetical protein
VASQVSHGVNSVWFQGRLQGRPAVVQLALVVAQSESTGAAPTLLVVLQSAPLPIGRLLQPPVAGFGLPFESIQPPSPAN